MSNPEVNSSAVTPQHSTITSTTEDDNQIKLETKISAESSLAENDENQSGDNTSVIENENIVRSESVIKSISKPLFVSSSTPVIKVVDSSQESNEKDVDNGEARKSIGASVITQTSTQCASSQNSTSFLHSASSPTPANPFLRTSSFSSNINSNSFSDNTDLNSESSFIFAPPKLLAPFSSNNLFDTSSNFQRPSVVKTADSNVEDTTPTIKTFISLNKEDIGKIKTPAFITNSIEKSTSSFSNGSTSGKESENVSNADESKPIFTFGQNLQARVVFDCKTSTASDLKAEINSTSDNLISFSDVTNFESSIKDNSRDSMKSDDDSKGENETLGSSSQKNGDSSDGVFKRKFEVITGEEDEQNVLSIHGKLYAWDTDKTSWIEKGRGHLRLNDVIKNERLCSRLVMRTSGALRVILNAHVVAGMKFELANDNCLRFTNVDGIYMVKANPKDIDQLNSAIEYRLREITKRVKTDFNETEELDDVDEAVVDSI